MPLKQVPASSLTDIMPEVELPDLDGQLVFLVDDDDRVLTEVDLYLRSAGFRVAPFTDPTDALASFAEESPRVLVTDDEMPGVSGIELAVAAQELDPDVQIILITGAGDEAAAQAALRLGAADYLKKPLDLEDLSRIVQRAVLAYARNEYNRSMQVWLREEVVRRTSMIQEVTLGALTALVNALEARSPYFVGHSQKVASTAARVARAMNLAPSETEAIFHAGLLHDIGMISVPDGVVQKPQSLSEEESAAVRDHCRKGVEILEPIKHLGPARRYVLEHHERCDGSGYPDAKVGDDIALGSQIVGVAETWTALTEQRAYRQSMSKREAMETIRAASGQWYSAAVVQGMRAAVSM